MKNMKATIHIAEDEDFRGIVLQMIESQVRKVIGADIKKLVHAKVTAMIDTKRLRDRIKINIEQAVMTGCNHILSESGWTQRVESVAENCVSALMDENRIMELFMDALKERAKVWADKSLMRISDKVIHYAAEKVKEEI